MILLTFGMNPLKQNSCRSHLKNDMVVVGVIFSSLFLDIDGQSLRIDGYFRGLLFAHSPGPTGHMYLSLRAQLSLTHWDRFSH